MEIKIYSYDVDYMSKLTDIPIFGKKNFEIFYPGTSGTIRRILVCSTRPNSLFKLWHCVDHELFSARSNFAT